MTWFISASLIIIIEKFYLVVDDIRAETAYQKPLSEAALNAIVVCTQINMPLEAALLRKILGSEL